MHASQWRRLRFRRFTAAIERDKEDRIPEGGASPKPDDRYIFRGHMLDAKTLAFALTDRGLNLEGACELFGVEHAKQKVKRHGIITPTTLPTTGATCSQHAS
jgi:hypothetical protein